MLQAMGHRAVCIGLCCTFGHTRQASKSEGMPAQSALAHSAGPAGQGTGHQAQAGAAAGAAHEHPPFSKLNGTQRCTHAHWTPDVAGALDKAQDVKRRRVQLLEQRVASARGITKFADWLAGNRGSFKAPVYGPLCAEVNVADPHHQHVVQQAISSAPLLCAECNSGVQGTS